MENDSKVYKIGTLARECGISPHLVRAWERRYHFIEPVRGSGGQRLFGHGDLLLLQYITAAIRGGARVGELAALGRKRLLLEAGAGGSPAAAPLPEGSANDAADSPAGRAEQLVAAAIRVDGPLLRATLAKTLMELCRDVMVYEVIPHAMALTDAACVSGAMGIAGEHLISGILEQFIRNALEEAHKAVMDEEQPTAVCCCFPDEEHNIGLLTVAYALARRGWRIVFLGSAMPLAAVGQSIRQIRPESVWLSVTTAARFKKHRVELAVMAARQHTRIVIGGRGAPRADKLVHQAGCELCPALIKIPEDIYRLADGGLRTKASP